MVELPARPVDKELHGKEFSMLSFDPRRYSRKETRFIIFQVDEVSSPLRAVSPKHEDEMMESQKSDRY